MIPTVAVLMVLQRLGFIGFIVSFFLSIFILPWLVMNFYMKETFSSLWSVGEAFKKVFNNFGDYVFVLLKSIVYSVFYLILSIVLVGIPCSLFGKNFFFADFYSRSR
jgi:hypothetical protein